MFLYSSNEYTHSEIKNTKPFAVTQETKYVGINLTKPAQGSYNWKKLKRILINGEIYCVHGLENKHQKEASCL